MQQEILSELHTLERIGEMLDVVDIVLGFLSSGGGSSNADMPFEEYVETVLKMKPESHKVHCLRVILCSVLWLFCVSCFVVLCESIYCIQLSTIISFLQE